MVLTIEPGIYIATDNTKVPKRWRGIGVRVEDDVVVTEQGCDVLTADVPKRADEIEALMPEHLIVRAVAKMKDGTIHETESRNPPGHPLNPMSNDDIAAKFRSQAEPVIDADRCGKVIEAWSGLKDADDLRPLIAMMDFPGN